MKKTTMRLKNLCVDSGQYGLNVPSGEYVQSGVRLIRTSDISAFGTLRQDDPVYVGRDIAPKHRLRAGDMLLSRSGTIGRGLLVGEDLAGSTFAGYLIRFRPSGSVDPGFLYYLTSSARFQGTVAAEAVSSTIMNFNAERYANISVEIPSLENQRRVSSYLDGESSLISRTIERLRASVSVAQERIDLRIGEFIQNSSLVNGGEGPSIPIRRVLEKVSRPPRIGAPQITAYRDGQVTTRDRRRVEGYTESYLGEGALQGVVAGDVVIHGLDGFAGAIGDSEQTGSCSPVYHVCRCAKDESPIFYGRMLRLLAVGKYLELFATSTRERAVDFRNWGRFGAIPVPVVERWVQWDLQEEVLACRALASRVDETVRKLDERRLALITAAVDGDMDVTTAREAEL